MFLFDERAARDGTTRRASTVITAHEYFRPFDRRGSESNGVQKFEALGIILYRATRPISYAYFDVGGPGKPETLDHFLLHLLGRVVERNPDRFRFADGRLVLRSGYRHEKPDDERGD